MPVWHGKTKELVAKGELVVIGITQEQHPDRCRLFAQWKELDFPILWDPFNLTNVSVVPIATAVDEHGVVQLVKPDPRRFDEQFVAKFMARVFSPPEAPLSTAEPIVSESLAGADSDPDPNTDRSSYQVMARLLWPSRDRAVRVRALNDAVRVLELRAARDGAIPRDLFRAGVARRMRTDSPIAEALDFQRAIDLWLAGLMADPNQYIWRRRIQQWGPRLDKPYPFYDWVAKAQEFVTARGEAPHPVLVPLSGSEVATASKALPRMESAHVAPDPKREVEADDGALVRVESATALHTGIAGPRVRIPVGTSRVHLTLRTQRGVHWAPDADPPIAWITVPKGWSIQSNLHTFEVLAVERPAGAVTIDFEVAAPQGPPSPTELRGYALYSVCKADGTCVYRRQDFTIAVPMPAVGGGEGEDPGEGDGGGH